MLGVDPDVDEDFMRENAKEGPSDKSLTGEEKSFDVLHLFITLFLSYTVLCSVYLFRLECLKYSI